MFIRQERREEGRDGVRERGSYYESLDNLGQQLSECVLKALGGP